MSARRWPSDLERPTRRYFTAAGKTTNAVFNGKGPEQHGPFGLGPVNAPRRFRLFQLLTRKAGSAG